MKLQFDAKQAYQVDAVSAIVDLFDGQPLNKPDYATILQTFDTELFDGVGQTDLGIGNKLIIDRPTLLKNLQRVQERGEVDVDQHLEPHTYDNNAPAPLNFSVEMEPGTGKTYVYLRTIFELSRRYGFKKFIIVVPSVAIREGVLKKLEITGEHFKALFNGLESEYFVYDAKKVNRLRQFAISNQVQILVNNIDAFRKNFTGTEAARTGQASSKFFSPTSWSATSKRTRMSARSASGKKCFFIPGLKSSGTISQPSGNPSRGLPSARPRWAHRS